MNDHPTLQIGPLIIRPVSRYRSAPNDVPGLNWIYASAEIEVSGAYVRVDGIILETRELKRFRDALQPMYDTVKGEAEFDVLEAEVKVRMVAHGARHIGVNIDFRPHTNQRHHFGLGLDQTYLPDIIGGCEALLEWFEAG